MGHLHEDPPKANAFGRASKIKFLEDKRGQEIQDEIFSKMSADKKIHLASGFFELAKELKKLDSDHGTRKTTSRYRGNSQKA